MFAVLTVPEIVEHLHSLSHDARADLLAALSEEAAADTGTGETDLPPDPRTDVSTLTRFATAAAKRSRVDLSFKELF